MIRENLGKLKRILCPYCQKNYLFFMGHHWRCKDCVYMFRPEWFDYLTQFEKFIKRHKQPGGIK